MKACILAGGEGRRLRPLTSMIPKPMAPILGRPVIGRTVELLRQSGVREMAVTLMYQPEAIREYLGDGREQGVILRYSVETSPLGTAGAVGACRDYLTGDDVIVVSGDAVFDLDLRAAAEFHREKRADVTILLSRQPEPLEYGLVDVDGDGRVRRFLEKPSWGQVFTDTVNTGIYLLSPAVLDRIPRDRPCDFAGELFPDLLRGGGRIYGYAAEGYWCDVGDTEAYLRCSADAIHGAAGWRAAIPYLAREVSDGVWTAPGNQLPVGVTVEGSVCIHPSAVIQSGAHIGPDVYVGASAFIGTGSTVRESVIEGTLAACCEAEGAIVCAGAETASGCVLERGSVLGSGVRLGENCRVRAGVRIYPGVCFPENSVVHHTVTAGGAPGLAFENGAVTGSFGTGLTPELMCAFGSACGELSRTVAIGCAPGADTRCLMQSAVSGMTAAGCRVYAHDVEFAAGASSLARMLCVPLSVFIDREEEIALRVYGADGRTLAAAQQRKLEGGVRRGDFRRVPGTDAGIALPISGGTSFVSARAARPLGFRTLRAAVQGRHPAAAALENALRASGFPACELHGDGVTLAVSRDGYHFSAEQGATKLDGDETETLVYLAAMLDVPGLTLALPEDAPEAYERMAAENGAHTVRLGRDPSAVSRWEEQRYTHDAIAGAVWLLAFLDRSGATLAALRPLLPVYGIRELELECSRGRGEGIRELAHRLAGADDSGRGIVFHSGGGCIRVTPGERRRVLRVVAEGYSAEMAGELAADFAAKAGAILKKESSSLQNENSVV